MENEIVKTSTEIVSVSTLDAYIKASCSNLLPNEIESFKEIAMAFGLNPFKREIYGIAYGKDEKRSLSIVTGFEVYLKRAERTGMLDGWEVKIGGKLERYRTERWGKNVEDLRSDLNDPAYAEITIYRKDRTKPFTWRVEFDEYNGHNKFWFEKPWTMIKKVVMAQGFRFFFSDELAGIPYTPDEIQDHSGIPGLEEIKPEKEKLTPPPTTPQRQHQPSSQPVGSTTQQQEQQQQPSQPHTKKDTRTPEEIKIKFDAYIQKKQTDFGASEVETILEKFRNDNGEFNPEKFVTIAEALEKKFPTVKGAAK